MNKKTFKSHIALIVVVLSVLAIHFGMTTPNPVTGVREVVLISVEKEINIGKENYAALQAESGGLYFDNPDINVYVAKVGHRLAAVSDRPDLPFQFVVLDSDIPNAWALPGGKIAINTGLLALLDNEAELASILAHEIVHATARHTAQRIEREMLLKGAFLFDAATSPLGLVSQALEIHGEIQDYKYSRDAESEADYYGMIYMARAGYNVQAAATAHQKLEAFFEHHEMSRLETLYITHPSDETRIESALSHAKEYDSDGFVGTEEFHQTMSQIIP